MARQQFLFSALLIASLSTMTASACLWDRDTLATEVRGMPNVVRVITGRFERNPPLFYELRLKRLAVDVASNPGMLELYDDAGVACDRLGRGDEAIRWMAKKREQMDRAGDSATVRDHWYRYYANLGTFHAHRWVRGGANRKELADLKRARDLIAAAIKINPNAHFGREKYQLMAIEWLLSAPKVPGGEGRLPDLFGTAYAVEKPHDAVAGLIGLIALGNAWESVDIFNALTKALRADGYRASVAHLAYLRASELIDQGRKSMLPGAPTGESLKKMLIGSSTAVHPDVQQGVETTYRDLRREAEQYQAQRTAYMTAGLQAGRHPDTDPNFWEGYREPPPPEIRDPLPWAQWFAGLAAIAVLLGAVKLVAGWLRRRRRRAFAS
jgi:hypothetical protein